MSENGIVYVVDDDAAVRESLVWLLGSVGLRAIPFASAAAFLDASALTGEALPSEQREKSFGDMVEIALEAAFKG